MDLLILRQGWKDSEKQTREIVLYSVWLFAKSLTNMGMRKIIIITTENKSSLCLSIFVHFSHSKLYISEGLCKIDIAQMLFYAHAKHTVIRFLQIFSPSNV